MDYIIRPVRPDEWAESKALRLAALADPDASVAFVTTLAEAHARPDGYWQERTRVTAAGETALAFVAESPAGEWAGTVTAQVEKPDGPDAEHIFGGAPSAPQTQLIGVYVRPEHRGTGLAQELVRAGVEWSWSLADPCMERVRLHVHQQNLRALAFYRKLGFEPTGRTPDMPGRPGEREYELALSRPEA
ncbi:GNAT family N-acetyltransferase [Streptomyces sp. NPDC050610]|uniref:GNAT family N-acetyltransferase n=1 Tax=Streptomyces sp. NPDC050610 TaxID=3157097 RepID=UPI0034365299